MAQPGENAGILGSFQQGLMISKDAVKAMKDRLDRQELARVQVNDRFKDMSRALRASTRSYVRAIRSERESGKQFRYAAMLKRDTAESATKHAGQIVDNALDFGF